MSKHIYTLEISVNDPLDVLSRDEVLDIVDNQVVPLFIVKGGTAWRSLPVVVVEHEIKMVEQEIFVSQDKFDTALAPDTKIASAAPKTVIVGDRVKTTRAKKPTPRKKA
jgi:hypothetical protein